MAISSLSDIVLDVARAADPQQYRTSVAKLQRTGAQHLAASAQMASPPSFAEVSSGQALEGMRPPVEIKNQAEIENPHRKFEAFMLQNFITEMFTSDTSSVFGKGAGADFWKTTLAQMMAEEMAEGGGIGIAALLDERSAGAQPHLATNIEAAAAEVFVEKSQINLVRQLSRGNQI